MVCTIYSFDCLLHLHLNTHNATVQPLFNWTDYISLVEIVLLIFCLNLGHHAYLALPFQSKPETSFVFSHTAVLLCLINLRLLSIIISKLFGSGLSTKYTNIEVVHSFTGALGVIFLECEAVKPSANP